MATLLRRAGRLSDQTTQQVGGTAALERPLFHPSRRPLTEKPAEVVKAPEPVAAPPPPPPPSPAETMRLKGVIISSGQRIAVFETIETGTIQKVRENQTVSGWTLRAVHSNRVRLELNGASAELPIAVPQRENGSNQKADSNPDAGSERNTLP